MQSLRDQVNNLALTKGVLRSSDLRALGASNSYLSWLASRGDLVRVGRGLYASSEARMSSYQSLMEVATRNPNATICLISALAFHGIGTQSPPSVWVAIGHKDRVPSSDSVPIIAVRMTRELLDAGVEERLIDGITVRITGVAKTIADCFKFRSKVGTDVAVEALKDALRRNLVHADDLYRFAKIDRVWNVIEPYAEAIS